MKTIKQKGNGTVGFIVIIGLIWLAYSYFSDDEPETNSYNSYSQNSYNYNTPSYNYNSDYADYAEEPENPYDEGTGHSAGYEWAEENDVSSCGGNSDSFIEGCEEYLSQQEE